MFSFYLGFAQSNSELVFGGFNPKTLVKTDEIYYHPVVMSGKKNDSQRWSIQGKSVIFGSLVMTLQLNPFILVDSGTSLIVMSTFLFR